MPMLSRKWANHSKNLGQISRARHRQLRKEPGPRGTLLANSRDVNEKSDLSKFRIDWDEALASFGLHAFVSLFVGHHLITGSPSGVSMSSSVSWQISFNRIPENSEIRGIQKRPRRGRLEPCFA